MATKIETLTAANKGQGCLGKAADDEPVFVLRAQDRFAPELIETWADRVERNITPNAPVTERSAQRSIKVRAARALAHQMRAWQALNDCKTPD